MLRQITDIEEKKQHLEMHTDTAFDAFKDKMASPIHHLGKILPFVDTYDKQATQMSTLLEELQHTIHVLSRLSPNVKADLKQLGLKMPAIRRVDLDNTEEERELIHELFPDLRPIMPLDREEAERCYQKTLEGYFYTKGLFKAAQVAVLKNADMNWLQHEAMDHERDSALKKELPGHHEAITKAIDYCVDKRIKQAREHPV